MKKLIKYFIKKKNPIFKLFYAFVLLFGGVFTCCLLGSWTYNQYGSYRDNIVDNNKIKYGRYKASTGAYVYEGNTQICCEFTSISYGITYTVSTNIENFASLHVCVYTNNNENTFIDAYGLTNNTYFENNIRYATFTISHSNAQYMTINFGYGADVNINNVHIWANQGITPIPYQPYDIPNYKSTAQVDNIFYKTNNEFTYLEYTTPYCVGCTPYNSTCSFSVKGGLSNDYINNNLNCYYMYPSSSSRIYKIPQGNYYFWFNRYNKECYPTLFIKDTANSNNYFYVDGGSFSVPSSTYVIEYILFDTSEEESNDFCIIDLFLYSINSPTTAQYNNLDNNYQNYRDTHSYTNEEYSSLQQSYNNLSNSYSSLQQDYNNLRSNYNALLDSYNSLANVGSVIPSSYTINIASQNGSVTNYDFTINATLDSDLYIDALGYLKVSDIYNDFIVSQQYGNVILVTLNESVSALNYDLMFNVNGAGNNINLMVNFDSFTPSRQLLFGLDNNGNPLTLTNFIKYQDAQVSNVLNYSYNQFALVYTNVGNDLSNIKLNGQGDYNLGYVNGLAQNNQDFLELQQDYDTLNNNYNSLQQSYDTLHARYDEIADTDLGFSMTKLVWSIAATPFESFKSIWSVDFLDFNIASFVTGILSIFVIVWLFKKIF